MTEPSKAAVEKAMSLCNRDNAQPLTAEAWRRYTSFNELARFIDHVSEVAKPILKYLEEDGVWSLAEADRNRAALRSVILPDPEPDVLEQSMRELEWTNCDTLSEDLRAELAKRGYEIRKVQP